MTIFTPSLYLHFLFNAPAPYGGTPSVPADVMADALVAEKAKLEPLGQQGTLQSTCYAYRFFFLMVLLSSRTPLED